MDREIRQATFHRVARIGRDNYSYFHFLSTKCTREHMWFPSLILKLQQSRKDGTSRKTETTNGRLYWIQKEPYTCGPMNFWQRSQKNKEQTKQKTKTNEEKTVFSINRLELLIQNILIQKINWFYLFCGEKDEFINVQNCTQWVKCIMMYTVQGL